MDVPRTRAISALHVPESLLPHLLSECAQDDTHGAWKITHVIRTRQGEAAPGHVQPDRSRSQRLSRQPSPSDGEEEDNATCHEEHRVDVLSRRGYAQLVQYLSKTATLLVAFDYGSPYDQQFYERVLDAAIEAQVSFILFISLMTSADDEGAAEGEFVRRHREWKNRIVDRCEFHHAWVHTTPSFQDLLLWNFPDQVGSVPPTPARAQDKPSPEPSPSPVPSPEPSPSRDLPATPSHPTSSPPTLESAETEESGVKESQELSSDEAEEAPRKKSTSSEEHARETKVLRSPFSSDQRVALVDCQDVARTILAIIQDPSDHADQEYQITGRETLTVGGLIEVLNQATKDYDFTYEQDNSLRAWKRAGYDEDWSRLVAEMIGSDSDSPLLEVMSLVSDDVEELTGLLPNTFEEFIPDLLVILQEQWGQLQLAPEDTVDLSRAIAVAQPPSEDLQRMQSLCQNTASTMEQMVVSFQMDCERQMQKLYALFPEEREALADWTDDPSQIRELEGSQAVMIRSLRVLQQTIERMPDQVEKITDEYKETMEKRVHQYEEALRRGKVSPPNASPSEAEEGEEQSPEVSSERVEKEMDDDPTEAGLQDIRQPFSRAYQPKLGTPHHEAEPGYRSTLPEESDQEQTKPMDHHTSPPRQRSRKEVAKEKKAKKQAREKKEEKEKEHKRRKVGRIRHKIKSSKNHQQTGGEENQSSSPRAEKEENEKERKERRERRRQEKREATAGRLHTFKYGDGSVNSSSISYSSSFSSDLSFSSDSTSDEMPYMNKDDDEVESLMRGEYENREANAAPEPLFLPLRPEQFADEMQPHDYFRKFIRVEESSSLDINDLPEAFDDIPQVDGERRMDELGIPSTRPRRAERHSRKTCSICESNFSVVNRRHHCRACGQLVDRQCAKNKMVLPNLRYFKPVRICKQCKVVYEKKYKPLMSTA